MDKGEIWILELPRLNGREQFGARPAVIASDTKTGLVVVIPSTSNLETLKIPYTVRINSSQENGLEKDSIALIFQIRAVDKKRLKRCAGKLSNSDLSEVNKMLRKILKLEYVSKVNCTM